MIANFFYFFYYNQLKQWSLKRGGSLSISHALTIPAVAGALNVITLNPIFVLSSRLRAAKRGEFSSPAACLRELLSEGPSSLWNGVVPSLWLVSNPTIQYFVYERLKAILLRQARIRSTKVTSLEYFIVGAISKAAATVATYPVQVAQTLLRTQRRPASLTQRAAGTDCDGSHDRGSRTCGEAEQPSLASVSCSGSRGHQIVQTQPDVGEVHYNGTLDCLRWLLRERGLAGLFCGLESKLWQTVLTASLMFVLYERLAAMTLRALLLAPKSTRAPK